MSRTVSIKDTKNKKKREKKKESSRERYEETKRFVKEGKTEEKVRK